MIVLADSAPPGSSERMNTRSDAPVEEQVTRAVVAAEVIVVLLGFVYSVGASNRVGKPGRRQCAPSIPKRFMTATRRSSDSTHSQPDTHRIGQAVFQPALMRDLVDGLGGVSVIQTLPFVSAHSPCGCAKPVIVPTTLSVGSSYM